MIGQRSDLGKCFISCSLCKKSCNMLDADAAGWDWFTGYLPQRFVACNRCQRVKPDVVKKKRLEARGEARGVGEYAGITEEQAREMYFMFDSGLKWRDVMAHFNVTAPTVAHWLRRRAEVEATGT